MTWQKAIGFHFITAVFQLHSERRTQVDQIGIANVGEKRIGKSFGVFGPELIEISFPEKINKMREGSRRWYPMVMLFEMVFMEEFYMLHGTAVCSNVPDRYGQKPLNNTGSIIFMCAAFTLLPSR